MVLLPDPGPQWRKILERIPAPCGGRFYVVGGWVRDLLLLGPFSLGADIDLVTEGDLASWSRAVGEAFGSEVHLETEFLTARTVVAGEGGKTIRIDLARFRREEYEFPGVLPRVFPGSIEDDAGRRDFSMNAVFLEWSSDKKAFVRIIDLYGGREDIRQGRIRPLREEIFLEDPTRLFRWARLSVRLGLSDDASLAPALKKSLGTKGLWDPVGGARVYRELERLMREPDPFGVTERLFSSRIMESLTGMSSLSRARRSRLRRWQGFRHILEGLAPSVPEPELPDREMFFLALLFGLPRDRFRKAAKGLGLGERFRERLEKVIHEPKGWPFKRFYVGLEQETARDYGKMKALADGLDLTRVLLLALIGRESDQNFWKEYVGRERWIPPLLGGEALLGYPRIPPSMRGAVLAEIRALQRTGVLRDAGEARRWLERKVNAGFP